MLPVNRFRSFLFKKSKIIVTLIYVCLHEVGRKTGILQNVICRTETIDDDAAQQSPPLKNWPQTADWPTVVLKWLKCAKNSRLLQQFKYKVCQTVAGIGMTR